MGPNQAGAVPKAFTREQVQQAYMVWLVPLYSSQLVLVVKT